MCTFRRVWESASQILDLMPDELVKLNWKFSKCLDPKVIGQLIFVTCKFCCLSIFYNVCRGMSITLTLVQRTLGRLAVEIHGTRVNLGCTFYLPYKLCIKNVYWPMEKGQGPYARCPILHMDTQNAFNLTYWLISQRTRKRNAIVPTGNPFNWYASTLSTKSEVGMRLPWVKQSTMRRETNRKVGQRKPLTKRHRFGNTHINNPMRRALRCDGNGLECGNILKCFLKLQQIYLFTGLGKTIEAIECIAWTLFVLWAATVVVVVVFFWFFVLA